MNSMRILAIPLALAPLLGGCSSSPVSMAKIYTLVDEDGHTAGSVSMSPIGGGQVIDNNGTVIGRIVPPQ